ncbi:hypothetical protein SCLCIDRAFT_1207582 [Scleroderma citrinum Foug A]|uniref:CASTOR ACT domain-containing protein n=1 Tax=Scleroderma citrinum Foug A TaxID=1036808 RepID=A0A0C3A964_9AGAM|nr:hypothetical protein SCLCIDRAFT_1207582 [Scleroderma citrinum Foug A]
MPPLANHPSLHLQVLPQTFEVKQYSCSNDIPAEVLDQLKITLSRPGLFSLTRTDEEVSVVEEAHAGEGRWRCIKIMGPMDFGLTGVICTFTAPLKEAEVPVFVTSTWNTDYILVPTEKLDDAT